MDKFRVRDQVGKFAWALVVTVLKEIGETAMDELAKGLEEFRAQGKTPDGWTREEYLSYAIGRLRVVQSRDIGPFVVDSLLDWAIEKLVDVLEGKLENLDAEPPIDDDVDEPEAPPVIEPPVVVPPPVIEPPVVVPPQPPVGVPPPIMHSDPYFPTRYGPDDAIPYNRLKKGDKVYRDGLSRFVVPGLFDKFYKNVTDSATLIDIIEQDGKDVVR